MDQSNIEVVNRKLYEASVITLTFLFILSLFRLDLESSAKQEVILNFIPVRIGIIDAPFILGLAAMNIAMFNYYTKFIVKIRESPVQEILSLFGMASMLALNILSFAPKLFSFRFLLLAAFLGLNVLKNRSLYKCLRRTSLESRSKTWYKDARLYFNLSLVSGIIFFMLFNDSVSNRLLSILILGTDLHFAPMYYIAVPSAFYILFLYINCKLYLKSAKYFSGSDYVADWEAFENELRKDQLSAMAEAD